MGPGFSYSEELHLKTGKGVVSVVWGKAFYSLKVENGTYLNLDFNPYDQSGLIQF